MLFNWSLLFSSKWDVTPKNGERDESNWHSLILSIHPFLLHLLPRTFSCSLFIFLSLSYSHALSLLSVKTSRWGEERHNAACQQTNRLISSDGSGYMTHFFTLCGCCWRTHCHASSPHWTLLFWVHPTPDGAVVGIGEVLRVRQWPEDTNRPEGVHGGADLGERIFRPHRPAPNPRIVEEEELVVGEVDAWQ